MSTSVKETYKDRDVEELIDIYFTRPVGFVLAKGARTLGLTPNAVTIISMITGVISGHLFYYTSLSINIIGIFLKIFSNILDSTDGQLARMTNSRSNLGRMLDGTSGSVIYVSIYIHLCLRYIHNGGSEWIFLVAALAGISHFYQCGWEDLYRNAYLFFVKGKKYCEIEKSENVKKRLKTNPPKRFIERVFGRIEYNYIVYLESFSQRLQEFKDNIGKIGKKDLLEQLPDDYKNKNKPMMKYYNILTINSRQYALILFILIKLPELFFVFELTLLNFIFLYAFIRQQNIIKYLDSKYIDQGTA